jgi:EpsI family protein
MVAGSAAAEWARPTIKDSDLQPGFKLEQLVPLKFGDWRVDSNVPVIVPPPDQQAVLDKIYNQILARTYVNSQGQRIMLSLAYGGDQSDGLTVHLPEVCYVAQGFKLEWSRDSRMRVLGDEIDVRELLTTMGRRVEPITYWVVIGDRATISTAQRRIVSLRYGLRRRIPEGMLFRVSSIDGDSAQAFALQRGFIGDLVAHVSAADKLKIFGVRAPS